MKLKRKKNKNYLRQKINYNIYIVLDILEDESELKP